jgi:diaminopropionate ammonia-lyase
VPLWNGAEQHSGSGRSAVGAGMHRAGMTRSAMWWRSGGPAERRGVPRAVPGALLDFHRRLPGYAPSPLIELPGAAARLGVGQVLVKDESDRFGLPAFKMLGASWAVARVAHDRIGDGELALSADALRRRLGSAGVELRLFTATAGNHGRSVARTARLLGASARVWTPAETPGHLRAAIAAEGAEVVVVPGDYDDAVRHATEAAAADDGATLVQDTAESAEEIVPARIVEGYATLLHEIRAKLGRDPDVIAVPTGVGSLALAVATYSDAAMLTVESVTAACMLAGLRTGERRTVPTGSTVLAGLNAGTVSGAAWPVLRERVAAAVAVTDDAALAAARELHGAGVRAGPCGGASLAGVGEALAEPAVRAALGVGRKSCVVVLSTDGSPPEA